MKQNNKIFALIDVNNCYVSCERMFNPNLNNKPVIVLSNNDGCAVARSQEAKDIGIKMGVPLYQIRDVVKKYNVQVLSSNYSLYEEMSRRFHKILLEYVTEAEQEIYSIDECFLDLTAYEQLFDLTDYAHQMRDRIQKWIGLPVCVGIGRSKTQAKIANHMAKKGKRFGGVCNLVEMDKRHQDHFFSIIDVNEIWGVGRKHTKKLKEMGINTVQDLSRSSPQEMKKLFSIVMARTVSELQGVSCIEIEHSPESKKQIISSRSFGCRVTELDDLKEAMCLHAQDACRRLRNDESLCGCIIVFVQSNPHDDSVPFYNKSASYAFPEATDSAMDFVKAATAMICHVYKAGIKYKKCGVILTCIEPKYGHTYDLLTDMEVIDKKEKLMQVLESVGDKFGKRKIGIGSCYLPNRNWSMSRDKLSQNPFTWDGLLKVN